MQRNAFFYISDKTSSYGAYTLSRAILALFQNGPLLNSALLNQPFLGFVYRELKPVTLWGNYKLGQKDECKYTCSMETRFLKKQGCHREITKHYSKVTKRNSGVMKADVVCEKMPTSCPNLMYPKQEPGRRSHDRRDSWVLKNNPGPGNCVCPHLIPIIRLRTIQKNWYLGAPDESYSIFLRNMCF